jgi:hypothetical protein
MANQLDGKWIHLSFRNDQIAPANALDTGQPILAAPWAPPGEFLVTTNANGEVSGSLLFSRVSVTLTVTGKVSDEVGAGVMVPWPLPPSVVLTATVAETEYRLRGWFIPDSNVIVGTVLCVKNDLAKAPDGTLGPWVLTKVG